MGKSTINGHLQEFVCLPEGNDNKGRNFVVPMGPYRAHRTLHKQKCHVAETWYGTSVAIVISSFIF